MKKIFKDIKIIKKERKIESKMEKTFFPEIERTFKRTKVVKPVTICNGLYFAKTLPQKQELW